MIHSKTKLGTLNKLTTTVHNQVRSGQVGMDWTVHMHVIQILVKYITLQ